VIDSRAGEVSTRRRRECVGCGHRFTTYEREALADEIDPRELDMNVRAALATAEALIKKSLKRAGY
jgi:transcriptional regulator NrdR family protein